MPAAPPAPRRRSQAERSETTRGALLDATIACLAEQGYSRTTTRAVARRAGVTPGALLHHFPAKGDLLGATMQYVLIRFAQEMLEHAGSEAAGPEHDARLLDRMWQLHKGPLFAASLELLVAARTDAALRQVLVRAREDRERLLAEAGPVLYPELSKRPGFAELVATGQAAMRGIALLAFASSSDPDEEWRPAREHILALSAALAAPRQDDEHQAAP
jgi:AcrR family transcriptional regulator